MQGIVHCDKRPLEDDSVDLHRNHIEDSIIDIQALTKAFSATNPRKFVVEGKIEELSRE